MADRVYVFDTTLRDGEQSPGATMNLDEKIRMARQLETLGVDIIEAGFPIASQGDFEAVQAISRAVDNVQVAGLCRAVMGDIDRCWEAVKDANHPRIHTFLATSEIHMKYKLGKTADEVLAMTEKAVRHAAQYTDNVEFSAEDASRSDWDFLVKVTETAIDAGATVVNIPDTVGYTQPFEYYDMIKYLMDNVKNVDKAVISVHCHNDLARPSPTVWPPSRPVPVRWNARCSVLESVRVMRRSKIWSWRSTRARNCTMSRPASTPSSCSVLSPSVADYRHAHSAEQGHRWGKCVCP